MGKMQIAWKHMMPHLLPQLLVGVVLLFPHAILHEASITFLGFGLPPEQPASMVNTKSTAKPKAKIRVFIGSSPFGLKGQSLF